MTFKEILEKYEIAYNENYDDTLDVKKVIFDILKASVESEKRIPQYEVQTIDQHKQMYINNGLWTAIGKASHDDGHNTSITTYKLRKILEKFQILGDEKDVM